MATAAWIILGMMVLRTGAQLVLERINRRHVRAHAGTVPEAFRGAIDGETYDRATRYTLAKNGLAQVELLGSSLLVGVVVFSGILPWFWGHWTGWAGTSVWASAAGLFLAGIALSIPGLPLEWWSQFRLEARFGFNTSTQATWWFDRLKTLLVAAILGLPLLALLLQLAHWTGRLWWLWGWVALMGFQMVMMILAPVVILPLFNKFTPLAEGALRDRLLELARRTRFQARRIEVMDGSRRSRHANAFFTGLGGFRKIVLFDTLISQLEDAELEAVLAHEIGHYRLRHLPKLLAWSGLWLLAGFAALGWLAEQPWFFAAFGFATPSLPIAFLLFALLADTITFWFTPLGHLLSRRFEFQADAFAAAAVTVAGGTALIAALRKLHRENLANLTPHPLYSFFYYSHPTLVEREEALRSGSSATAPVTAVAPS